MRNSPRRRSGFTMLEIVIGLFLLTVGALGYAVVTAGMARAFLLNARRGRASEVARTQTELLLRQGCSAVSGSAVRFGTPVEWSLSGGPTVKTLTVVVTRPASSASRRDSLTSVMPCS